MYETESERLEREATERYQAMRRQDRETADYYDRIEADEMAADAERERQRRADMLADEY